MGQAVIQLWTPSRLRVVRACLRQHYYRYVLAIQTEANDVMRFGTVGHKALEAWYRAWQKAPTDMEIDEAGHLDEEDGEYLACSRREALDSRLPAALDAITGLSHTDTIKLRVLVTAYHHRWGAEDWEILAVEVEFRYMLGDRMIGGKIDAIIRDRKDGRIYVVEHKTTGADASLGSTYWERLTIDTQVSIYIDGAAMLGYDISGCIYDVLKRPKHEPLLATPDDKREYTQGKGCRQCGGSAGGKVGILRGRGHAIVEMPDGTQRLPSCPGCAGTGWKLDAAGVPQEPRLHANLRGSDETPEEFEARLVEAIAENPDAMLLRGVVVRLEHELPAMRQDICDDIDRAETGLIPRNSDACSRGGGALCDYFDACVGRAGINDQIRFPRGRAHPELESAT